MQLTVLVENNTLIDRYFHGEPGLSFYLQHRGQTILFDTGYSDILLGNADKMGIDLGGIDTLVLSHGHNDHTRGLGSLLPRLAGRKPRLIAHPQVLERKTLDDGENCGITLSREVLEKHFSFSLSREPQWLAADLVFLGEIPRGNNFEAKKPIGHHALNGAEQPDFVSDDSALVYRAADGLVLITGCSHAGICNMIEYAKKVCGDERIVDIIGGFHLQKPDPAVLDATLDYLRAQNLRSAHACHCTDLASKIRLAQVVDVREVGVGLQLSY